MKRSLLKRTKGLKPSKPKPKVKIPTDVRIRLYHRQATLCIVCQHYLSTAEIHHCLPKSKWPEHAEDIRNLVLLHPYCHANHEAASRRIRQSELPEATVTWIRSLGGREQMYLERTYPVK